MAVRSAGAAVMAVRSAGARGDSGSLGLLQLQMIAALPLLLRLVTDGSAALQALAPPLVMLLLLPLQ